MIRTGTDELGSTCARRRAPASPPRRTASVLVAVFSFPTACSATLATAPHVDPDVVRRCPPTHTFSFDGPGNDPVRCSTTPTGVHRFCIQSFTSRFREALTETLSAYLSPTAQASDYVVSFPVDSFDLMYSATDNSFTLSWQFVVRDRAGSTVVALHGTTHGPAETSLWDANAIQQALASIMRDVLASIRHDLDGSMIAAGTRDCAASRTAESPNASASP